MLVFIFHMLILDILVFYESWGINWGVMAELVFLSRTKCLKKWWGPDEVWLKWWLSFIRSKIFSIMFNQLSFIIIFSYLKKFLRRQKEECFYIWLWICFLDENIVCLGLVVWDHNVMKVSDRRQQGKGASLAVLLSRSHFICQVFHAVS